MASPVSLSFTDPDPVIHTAKVGTLTILQSALENSGPQLKAFVLTSSIAAIRNPHEPPHVYNEEQWNTTSLEMVAQMGRDTPGIAIYAASKTAAERVFWEFRDQHKPSFTFAAINPG
jgi:nucleoside-diphosphate-sugar epimerase